MEIIINQAIKVETSSAEILRQELIQKKLLRTDLKIMKNSRFVYFPIIDVKDLKKKLSKNMKIEICEYKFTKQPVKIDNYKELLSLPDLVKKQLPTSFDMIGSIILIKLDKALVPFESKIGDALLNTHHQVRSVFRISPVEGEFRTRSLFLIAGEDEPVTIHKEFGLYYEVDVRRAYFNPRLANERMRIASQIKPGEIILDMFTGIAPFPLMIVRYGNPKLVLAVEKNIKAFELAQNNLKRNNILTDVKLFHEDAKKIPILLKSNQMYPNRIIMNLPFHAHEFFSHALQCIQKKAIIHFYTIGTHELITKRIELLDKIGSSHGFSISIKQKREIKSYAPHEIYMGIDITAKKSEEMPT